MALPKVIFYFVVEYVYILQKQIESLVKTNTPNEWKYGSKGDIILIPGFFETWVFMETIANCLNQQGYKIHVVRALQRNTLPIQNALKIVADYMQENKLAHVTMLSHSKGGIIAKLLLDNPDLTKYIDRSISIATPYKGTMWGYMGVFSLYELTPNSKLIKSLQTHTKHNDKIVNFLAAIDNHIIPNKNAFLYRGENIKANTIGHTRILENKTVMKSIVAITTQ